MKKTWFKVLGSAMLMGLLLTGCGQDKPAETDSTPQDPPVSESVTEPNESPDAAQTEADMQPYSNGQISFEYDSSTMTVKETNGENGEFSVLVVPTGGEDVLPQVDFLSMDPEEPMGDITEDDYVLLAKDLVGAFYGAEAGQTTMTASDTVLNMSDPANRTASTIIQVDAYKNLPTIYANVSLQYNDDKGVASIVILDDEITSEAAVPYMKVFESLTIN